MKKCLLFIVMAAMLLLCSCNHLDPAENLPGTWRSEDGYIVTFDGSVMTVSDTSGEMIDGFPAYYVMSGNDLYLYTGDTFEETFECRVDGDALTLIYADSFMELASGSSEKTVKINLVRCDDD